MEGWFFATAALLVVSGIQKFADAGPAAGALKAAGLPHRNSLVFLLAVAEVTVGAGSLAIGDWWFAWAQAVLYAGFGGFVVLALVRRTPIASCGCFGRQDTPPTRIHVGVNVLAAAGAIRHGLLASPAALVTALEDQPMVGAPYVLFLVGATYALFLLLGQLPLLRIRR